MRDITVWTEKRGKVFYARWKQEDGTEKKRSLKTDSLAEARRRAVAFEAELNSKALETTGRVDLDWERAWTLYDQAQRTVRAQTKMLYQGTWERFWEARTKKTLGSVTKEDAIQWRARFEEPTTANVYNTRLKTVYNALITMGLWRGENPFLIKDMPVPERRDWHWLRPVQIEEAVTLAREISRDTALAVALMGYAGMRIGEVRAARWEWITPPSEAGVGCIHIPGEEGEWKTKSGRARTIPLAPQLWEVLREHVGEGAIVADADYYRAVKRIGGALCPAVIGLHPHDLRHSFGSNAADAGMDLYRIMSWMGHKDMATVQIYAHLAPQDDAILRVYPK